MFLFKEIQSITKNKIVQEWVFAARGEEDLARQWGRFLMALFRRVFTNNQFEDRRILSSLVNLIKPHFRRLVRLEDERLKVGNRSHQRCKWRYRLGRQELSMRRIRWPRELHSLNQHSWVQPSLDAKCHRLSRTRNYIHQFQCCRSRIWGFVHLLNRQRELPSTQSMQAIVSQ